MTKNASPKQYPNPTSGQSQELLLYRLGQVEGKADIILQKLDDTYSTKDYVDARIEDLLQEISLLKKIVFGAVGFILTGFMLAVVNFFIQRSS